LKILNKTRTNDGIHVMAGLGTQFNEHVIKPDT
jgi:hypothetical protein